MLCELGSHSVTQTILENLSSITRLPNLNQAVFLLPRNHLLIVALQVLDPFFPGLRDEDSWNASIPGIVPPLFWLPQGSQGLSPVHERVGGVDTISR